MKLPSSLSKILNNKYFYYFVLFLAGTNVLGYMTMGKWNAVVFFALVAYLVSHFHDNKSINILISIMLTNLLMMGRTMKEGLENKEDKEDKEDGDKKKDTQNKDASKIVEPSDDVKEESGGSGEDSSNTNTTIATSSVPPENMNTMSNKKRNRIDYASTVEDAYGDLSKILGGDGIKNLTDDTQRLMGQQQQLAEAMKSMTPLLETAKSMLDGFDMKNLNGLADFAKNFSASK